MATGLQAVSGGEVLTGCNLQVHGIARALGLMLAR